ncbi:UPF0481 protein At3g47200-like isoform X3 [Trifolium pratense]|uniref:UPF0481 protein At3g47200-like isoform X3 n=1 Tax=Trifolium pratense TaxID=57577 RepID=UPI001E695B2A|nr:UPF0481 protein At3g47200-like isoform X3 [Trifolium pratense]
MASQITLEQNFMKLQNSKPAPHSSRPKIQRVAEYLRTRENFEKHYTPKLVSIGPIHHGNENLKLGEKYKLMWAAQYIKNGRLDPHNLHKKIADNIVELKGLFADDVLALTGTRESLEGFTSLEEKLSWMLFVDGCSPLHILEHADLRKPEAMNIKVDQLILVMMDVILLENQLPYPVLKLLWKNDNEAELKETMKEFLKFHHWDTADNRQIWRSRIQGHWLSIQNESVSESPVHLLDLQRKIILTKSSSKTKGDEANNENQSQKNSEELMTYRNIQDLRAAGIKLKSSETRRPTDIGFSEGWLAAKLTLPEIVVDDTTKSTFLNLIAYEMCPDFENDYGICSFAAFMDSLIDHPEDVKELRSKGILLNSLGSDEEVADLFNVISTDLVPNPLTYFEVRAKIHKHYCNKCKTWIALGIHTYFNNPWAFIAFLAAFIALALTFIQTWFAINPAS